MRFEGRIERDHRFWLVEIAAFDALTQGTTKREALAMAEDLIETMASAKGFKVTVYFTGKETFDIIGQTDPNAKTVKVTATAPGGHTTTFEAQVRIDTPKERDYYENGGILHYVLRQLAA